MENTDKALIIGLIGTIISGLFGLIQTFVTSEKAEYGVWILGISAIFIIGIVIVFIVRKKHKKDIINEDNNLKKESIIDDYIRLNKVTENDIIEKLQTYDKYYEYAKKMNVSYDEIVDIVTAWYNKPEIEDHIFFTIQSRLLFDTIDNIKDEKCKNIIFNFVLFLFDEIGGFIQKNKETIKKETINLYKHDIEDFIYNIFYSFYKNIYFEMKYKDNFENLKENIMQTINFIYSNSVYYTDYIRISIILDNIFLILKNFITRCT